MILGVTLNLSDIHTADPELCFPVVFIIVSIHQEIGCQNRLRNDVLCQSRR